MLQLYARFVKHFTEWQMHQFQIFFYALEFLCRQGS